MNAITIMTVDDHPLLRAGISGALEFEADMKVVAEAGNGLQAVEMFRQHRPDVTLMDVRMPEMNGISAMTQIRKEYPDARIVVLTTYEGDVQALRAIKAGAAGYLLKSMLRKELIDTIRMVHAGQKRIPPEIANDLAHHMADEALSTREVDVLRLAALGKSNKRIGTELFISEETVKSHMTNILSKLSATDRTHAVTIALKRGILDLH
ncbi:DNA-binding NarL/FixJ family response regulator [Silvimonas terrae]|uniref:DNA-binding NarL/FixJ family response regulator n=1 Tax=Silvimonas terrae TaxID=300266 RepID=A0A840RBS6_9NEIS|nr:response regulator transcription factor [Silvimonas terrae]MBB5189782.1 DNA-binding NarL/FixJ family response regulator [Silvimonas terrae]